MSDLNALLTSSKALTSHLARPDLPSVNLSLDQVEAQSRRLVSRQPGSSNDTDRANYLLAQAHVDAPALANSIAHLNTSTTFTPLQPLQDTDIAGYLRHSHEQNLISTIEEGRRETQAEFYRVLEERGRRDWEAKKRRVFEELGGRSSAVDSAAMSELKKSMHGKSSLMTSAGPSLSLQMQSKMMVYDRVVSDLNAARLGGTSFPIIHSLIHASVAVNSDARNQQMTQNFHVLAKIAREQPSVPPVEHASAHILNASSIERQYAKAYLASDQSSDAGKKLREQITSGARQALEEQYWDFIEKSVYARPQDARLGGDPSAANKIRAYIALRYYRNGEWEDRIELVQGQPVWARLYFLVRTGHALDALAEARNFEAAIEHRESGFVKNFATWCDSEERRLPKPNRDHLQSVYNAHMLHASSVDPFKLALFKLMGKLEPTRRSVPLVTTTTEDWLWFQLAMVDEDEEGGLRGLSEVLRGYGERHFDGPPGQKGGRRGVWAGVLLMCGEFERAVAALWEHQETEIEAVHLAIALAYHGLLRVPSKAETSDMTPLSLSPVSPPALSLSTLIWRYVRQFVKMDAKEALQYVCCVGLCADQGDTGKEQVENAWELVRRVIVLANAGPAWEELVGGFRPDGSRFTGVIQQYAPLLDLKRTADFNAHILMRAAEQAQASDRIPESIKLYNLAGAYDAVVRLLARELGLVVRGAVQGDAARAIEQTAVDILRSYERTNRGAGREKEAVVKLLRVREAMECKDQERFELALEVMESTELIPLDGDVSRITRRAEEFRDLDEALQKNLEVYLQLTMDALAGVHRKVKAMGAGDAARQMTLASIRKKSRSLMIFAGMLKIRMGGDVYAYLSRLDVEIAL